VDSDDVKWFADPVRRRMWLLTKALEDAPLLEALAQANEAEAFLAERVGVRHEGAAACRLTVHQLSTSIH
jgi:hypothetical protein